MTNRSAATRIHVIKIQVAISADHHAQKLTRKILTELAQDAASAICEHDLVEGNAVQVISAEIIGR